MVNTLPRLGISYLKSILSLTSRYVELRGKNMNPQTSSSHYINWSKEDLIARIQSLEDALLDMKPLPSTSSGQKFPKARGKDGNKPPALPTHVPSLPPNTPSSNNLKPLPSAFPFDSYPKRKIAIKFCYEGWSYNGLAYQTDPTPLPMVEAVLMNALVEARLVDPSGGFEGCGWSRCGRTDKGVSAAGQVVAFWARSNIGARKLREKAKRKAREVEDDALDLSLLGEGPLNGEDSATTSNMTEDTASSEASKDDTKVTGAEEEEEELNYVQILNTLLPPSIRVLAWSPVSPEFDARFSCSYRHYKYFFRPSSPPYTPESTLDIEAMRDACRRLIGEHDFRNLCKVDPSKQIDNYKREIMEATINPVDPFDVGVDGHESKGLSDLYVLDLKGNGFLYHQVRHIMAILFLVGARMEKPWIVDALMNTGIDTPNPISVDDTSPLPIVPTKPSYYMADGLPLVLWDCGYKESDLLWRTTPSESVRPASSGPLNVSRKHTSIFTDLHTMATRNMIQMVLHNHFFKAGLEYSKRLPDPPTPWLDNKNGEGRYSTPLGAGGFQVSGKYLPLLERPRSEDVKVVNERWKNGAGVRRAEKKANSLNTC
ncbi:hypothetical protein FRC03_011122 [Tulasnella sp. 419]|nr:hypothetical protein FRC03_011122 [Tulasnella sp. 419]